MRRPLLAIGLVAIALVMGSSTGASARQYCYECVEGPTTQCMDCQHPVFIGHVSCIPYCNGTCSVGGPCEVGAVSNLRLMGEGTAIGVSDETKPLERVNGVTFVRNCAGMVVNRLYGEVEIMRILAETREIAL